MREQRRYGIGMALALAGCSALLVPAWAQQAQQPAQAQPPDPIEAPLGPPPKPVNLFVSDRPLVTVAFDGPFGPVRVTGTLDAAPEAAVRLTDIQGRTREARWSEIRELSVVRTASEGLPQGSYSVSLITDPAGTVTGGVTGSPGYLAAGSASISGPNQAPWRALQLPTGQLTLAGDNIGRLAIPTNLVTDVTMQPIRGLTPELPRGNVRLEVLPGSVVGVPLQDVITFRRDLRQNTVSMTLGTGELFTGRLVELPKVSVVLEPTRDRQPIALERIVLLEVTLPATSRTDVGTLGVGP